MAIVAAGDRCYVPARGPCVGEITGCPSGATRMPPARQGQSATVCPGDSRPRARRLLVGAIHLRSADRGAALACARGRRCLPRPGSVARRRERRCAGRGARRDSPRDAWRPGPRVLSAPVLRNEQAARTSAGRAGGPVSLGDGRRRWRRPVGLLSRRELTGGAAVTRRQPPGALRPAVSPATAAGSGERPLARRRRCAARRPPMARVP